VGCLEDDVVLIGSVCVCVCVCVSDVILSRWLRKRKKKSLKWDFSLTWTTSSLKKTVKTWWIFESYERKRKASPTWTSAVTKTKAIIMVRLRYAPPCFFDPSIASHDTFVHTLHSVLLFTGTAHPIVSSFVCYNNVVIGYLTTHLSCFFSFS